MAKAASYPAPSPDAAAPEAEAGGRSLSGFVWRYRKAALLLIGLLGALGLYFAGHLPVAIFPNLTVPRIIVSADSGDTPIPTMLANVTRPLENAVAGVPGVTKVLSTTQRGGNELDVNFAWGTDMQAALQKVQANVTQTQSGFPAGTRVDAELLNPSVFPVMGYSLTSGTLTPQALRHLALYTLRPRLLRVPGVRQISVLGGDTPNFRVQINPTALLTRGISVQDVEDALSKSNLISSVGSYDQAYLRHEVLVSGLLQSSADIARVTVAVKNRVPVTIGEVATVTRGVEKRTIATSGDGQDAVLVNVIKQPDGNTVQVSDGIGAALTELQPSLPRGVHFSLFYDQSQIVQEAQSSVIEAIVIGGLLALVVLMLFLGNLRAAAIVLMLLPLTLLITFGLMKALGQTLNIMTLGALAIALGLVIDDGIVVVENIFHALESGRPRREAISEGLKAITPAMVGSSLTTMAAFLPLTFLSGVTGQFFGPLALVMIATLFVSLALSLCLTPLLAEWLLPQKVTAPTGRVARFLAFFPGLFDHVAHGYAWLLGVCLRRRWAVLLCLLPVALGAYFLFNRLQTGFFPEFDEGGFVLDYRLPYGTSIAETDAACKKIEAILGRTSEVAAWSRRTGAQLGFDLTTPNAGDMSVRLKDKRARDINEVMDDVRGQVNAQVPAADVDFHQILQDNVGDIAGSPSPVEVKIFGDDTQTLQDLATKVADVLGHTAGVVDVNPGIVGSGPETVVSVNTERAQRYGLTAQDVTGAATAALLGAAPTSVQEGEEAVPIRVQLTHSDDVGSPLFLPSIPIASPVTGGVVPLGTVADVSVRPGTPQIGRENQRQRISVTAGLSGRDLGSAIKDIQGRVGKQVPLPPGYNVEYGGLYASQQESFGQLAFVLALAVLFVFSLLVIQFRSFRQSFALFVAALLSLSGVLLGLFVTHTQLNISSFTGAIMIVGIVTENGIVLFDFVNHLRREAPDRPLPEVMLDAGRQRLRPILMTTIGAILALFPLALGLGAGAAMQKPLAIAVIGGLSVSTLFTLLVAPVLFVSLEGLTRRSDQGVVTQ